MLNPQVEGILRATNTTLLSTIEPLVPNANQPVVNLALPHSLEVASFRYFEFVTTSLTISSATASENVRPGGFCDANSGCETHTYLQIEEQK